VKTPLPPYLLHGQQGGGANPINKMSIITITLEANNESEFIERLDQIRNAIVSNTLNQNELMDGSYQIESSNIELELV